MRLDGIVGQVWRLSSSVLFTFTRIKIKEVKMIKFEQINQDIATLPETDQQLVIDFIEILKKRQVSQFSIKKSVELDNNSFIELEGDTQNEEFDDSIIGFFSGSPNLSSEKILDRRSFLKLPIAERQRILAEQAEAMVEHYQKDTSWQE